MNWKGAFNFKGSLCILINFFFQRIDHILFTKFDAIHQTIQTVIEEISSEDFLSCPFFFTVIALLPLQIMMEFIFSFHFTW